MKRQLLTAFALAAFCSPLFAQDAGTAGGRDGVRSASDVEGRRWEAGAIFGEPTAGSFKFWFDRFTAVDAAAGWSFVDDGSFIVYGDVLFHPFYPDITAGLTPLYAGIGPTLRFGGGEDARLGIRFPVGLTYILNNAPISLFGEFAPRLEFTPDLDLRAAGGIGIRYVF